MTIDEGTYVSIGGVDQWVALRGSDDANPLLLILSGPGVALSAMAPFFAPWERDFTLVHWDQPGAGATFARTAEAAAGPLTVEWNAAVGAGPLSFERLARDGVAVAEWALRRAGPRPLVLLGLSAGTIVGLRMAKARPDLFAAYVGTGQVVHWGRQQRLAYDAVLRAARDAGRTADVEALERIGPPPWADVASDVVLGRHAAAFTPAEQAAFASLDPATAAAMRTPPPGARYLPRGVTLPDVRARAAAAFEVLRPELQAFDAAALGERYVVPMFFVQGDADVYTATSEVRAFTERLEAPWKGLELVPGGGHSAWALREEFLAALEHAVAPALGVG